MVDRSHTNQSCVDRLGMEYRTVDKRAAVDNGE